MMILIVSLTIAGAAGLEEDFKNEGGNSATYRRVDLVDIVLTFYSRDNTKRIFKEK